MKIEEGLFSENGFYKVSSNRSYEDYGGVVLKNETIHLLIDKNCLISPEEIPEELRGEESSDKIYKRIIENFEKKIESVYFIDRVYKMMVEDNEYIGQFDFIKNLGLYSRLTKKEFEMPIYFSKNLINAFFMDFNLFFNSDINFPEKKYFIQNRLIWTTREVDNRLFLIRRMAVGRYSLIN